RLHLSFYHHIRYHDYHLGCHWTSTALLAWLTVLRPCLFLPGRCDRPARPVDSAQEV
ncbi:hypothetical protein BJV78DRAFT_1261353, partial [Lactifluus subvellereus]